MDVSRISKFSHGSEMFMSASPIFICSMLSCFSFGAFFKYFLQVLFCSPTCISRRTLDAFSPLYNCMEMSAAIFEQLNCRYILHEHAA